MSRRSDEQGMTLVEVLLSVTILAVIIGPIAASVMLGLMTSAGTRERVADSASSQLVSAYFMTDVQSSDTVTVPSPADAAPCGGTGVVLQLDWDDPAPEPGQPTSTAVSYVERLSSDSNQRELHRVECLDGVETSDATVVFAMVPSLPPTVTCAPSSCSATPSMPRTVSLTVTAKNASANPDAYDEYTFTLQATRRQT